MDSAFALSKKGVVIQRVYKISYYYFIQLLSKKLFLKDYEASDFDLANRRSINRMITA